MSQFSAAILGGAGAMLGWGSSDFFAKKSIDEIGDLATLFWGQLIGVAALGIGVLATDATLSYSSGAWLALVGLGIVSGGSYLVLYRGFGKGQVSVLSPIFASYAGVAALLAAFTFHEPLPLLAKVALGVIFVGILMMTTDVRDIRGSLGSARAIAGVPEVVCAMLIFSGWLVLWDRFLRHRDWLPGTTVMRSVAVLALLAFAAVSSQSLKVSRRALWPYLGAIGLCDVGAYSVLSYGFSHSTLGSVVALISGAFSLPAIILARIFLRERLLAAQGLAAAIILGGVALVAVS